MVIRLHAVLVALSIIQEVYQAGVMLARQACTSSRSMVSDYQFGLVDKFVT